MNIDGGTVFLFIAGFFVLYVCCRVFLKPIKWLLRFLLCCVLGGGAIALLNHFSVGGIHFALNPLTSMITGVLGAPGLAMLAVLKLF